MLILYVGTSLVIWIAFRMVRGTIDRLKLSEFDRQIGAMFGLGKGALYCTLITLFAVTLMGDKVRETIVRSKSGHYIANLLDRSQAVIPAEIHEVVQPYIERFDQQSQDPSDEGILPPIPWLAEDQRDGRPDGHRSAIPQASSWGRNLDPTTADSRLPMDPQRWVPLQAQQPTSNGYGR
jgi:membrane protein required for colicin V production